MNSDSGATTSIWMATAAEIAAEGKLSEDRAADVCIVGAGIAGMTTAYLLAREGKRVIVLDDGSIGGGMTGRTTAHLVNALGWLPDAHSEAGRARRVNQRCRQSGRAIRRACSYLIEGEDIDQVLMR